MTTPPALRRPIRRDAGLMLVWVLVFASVVSWRQGVLYAGGSDPVVVAKAAVAVAAAVGAFVLWRTATTRRALSPVPVLFVFAIVGISLIGALEAGVLAANVVLAIRIAILTGTIVLIVTSVSIRLAMTTMLASMAVIGLFAAATSAILTVLGLHAAARGRLDGGIPPLAPNELATLVLPAAIGLLFVIIRFGLRPWPTAALVILTVVIVATGSRTALAVLAVGGLVLVVSERRLTFGVTVVALLGVLGAYIVLGFSSALTGLALRGEGIDRLLTLNSRTISWDAVLSTPPDSWAWWIGNGLSMKSIAVLGQAWKTQVFDSSWISSIAQDGVIGTLLLAVLVIGTVVAAVRRAPLGPLMLALTVTMVIRSFVENGLIDSSATFAVFLTVALTTWAAPSGSRSRADRSTPVEPGRELTVPRWAAPAGRSTD